MGSAGSHLGVCEAVGPVPKSSQFAWATPGFNIRCPSFSDSTVQAGGGRWGQVVTLELGHSAVAVQDAQGDAQTQPQEPWSGLHGGTSAAQPAGGGPGEGVARQVLESAPRNRGACTCHFLRRVSEAWLTLTAWQIEPPGPRITTEYLIIISRQ